MYRIYYYYFEKRAPEAEHQLYHISSKKAGDKNLSTKLIIGDQKTLGTSSTAEYAYHSLS